MIPNRLLKRLTVEELRRAIRLKTNLAKVEHLEREREAHLKALKKLDQEIAKLSGSNGSVTAPARRGRKRGRKKGFKVSAATRRKMSAAAKRRYAGNGKAAAPAGGKKKRRTMSAATRAKMAASAKARWAKMKGTS